jgi:hypothetical protein
MRGMILSDGTTEIVELDRVEIAAAPSYAWPFAAERRSEIDRHFADIQRDRPAVWNGRVLMLGRYAIGGGVLRGTCFETDYASLCAWRNWTFPDQDVCNVFGAAALRAADGAYLVGEMAPSTTNAGLRYFPCGTPEPSDVDPAGALDLDGNVGRELLEETGLDIGALDGAAGWTMVRDRRYLALLRHLRARENAAELRARIMRYIDSEQDPEFVDIHIVRGPDDLSPHMPRFMTVFLQEIWRR